MIAVPETWKKAQQPADQARHTVFFSVETLRITRDGLKALQDGIQALVDEASKRNLKCDDYLASLRRVDQMVAFHTKHIENNDELSEGTSIATLRLVKAGLLLFAIEKREAPTAKLPQTIRVALDERLKIVLEKAETGVLNQLRPAEILFEIMDLKQLSFGGATSQRSQMPFDDGNVGRETNTSQSNHMSLDIFISHSSKDSEIAEVLIELIRSATNLPAERIRCSSVDGYRLPGGASTDDQLKREVRDAICFVGLLTPSSLQSAYVFFELGARWGAELRFVPLLAAGATTIDLHAPLSGLNALSCDSASQIHQFLNELGAALQTPLSSAAAYDRHLQQLAALSRKRASETTQPTRPAISVPHKPEKPGSLSESATELLELIKKEQDPDLRGVVQIRKEIRPGLTHFFAKIQYAGSPLGMRSRQFREGVEELVAAGWLRPPEENPSTNTRTYEYRGEP